MIDHAPLSIFVAQSLMAVTPIVTFAIDLFTKSVLSFHVSGGRPGPDEMLAVIAKAEKVTSLEETGLEDPVRPRLIFTCNNSPGWKALLDRMAASGVLGHLRRSQNQYWSGMVGRLIGSSIGSIRLLNRNTKDFQRSGDPVVDLDQLTHMLEAGIQEINARRLPADIEQRPLRFGI